VVFLDIFTTLKHGVRHGLDTQYYPSGNKKSVQCWKDGERCYLPYDWSVR